jgi:hypothetical protein
LIARKNSFSAQTTSNFMQKRDTRTRLSGVSPAVLPRKSPAAVSGRGAESPAERIRHAEDLLRDLLLENDFGEDKILLARVENGLEQIQLKLSDLAGRQELFELWI